MNRLFIIGNGFDLAQGLPTSYNNFIDDFWFRLKSNYHQDYIKELLFIDESNTGYFDYPEIKTFEGFIKNIKAYANEYSDIAFDENKIRCIRKGNSFNPIFDFKNQFFKIINTNKTIDNWVDIENLYYQELKKIVHSVKITDDDSISLRKKKTLVLKLNKEFKQIENLFVRYLKNSVVGEYNFSEKPNDFKSIYNILTPINIFNDRKIEAEFLNQKDKEDLLKTFNTQKLTGDISTQSLFLNFNYTFSLDIYNEVLQKEFNSSINQIHGRIGDNANLINFGFGDEMDNDYNNIENINDNEYLEYFKSFKYFQNSNYKKLIDYINSSRFQVCIIGHSCGLSDRTLLNTIFEHENCASIKVYYHKDGDWDNYDDIVRNISRHFIDKKVMRERIVNKSLSIPFPQNVRFQHLSS